MISRELEAHILRLFHAERWPVGTIARQQVGSNGLGKTMIAKNLAHQALLKGKSVCFTTAAAMLTDLAEQEGSISLARRLKRYCRPELLVVD